MITDAIEMAVSPGQWRYGGKGEIFHIFYNGNVFTVAFEEYGPEQRTAGESASCH